MSFTTIAKLHKEIVEQVTQEHLQLSTFLPFNVLQLKASFTPEELKDLADFVMEMRSATTSNARAAALISKINSFATPVVKLLELAKVLT
jgi:hypothetical protein